MSLKKRFGAVGVAAATLLTAGAVMAVGPGAAQATPDRGAKPTVVLVHGLFADSGGWDGVTRELLDDGYPVVAAPNPLRGVTYDAAHVKGLLESIDGPIILVGHSYGGSVISTAATGNPNVKALVYIAGFAPDKGESANELAFKFEGSTLPETLRPVALPDGSVELYIDQKLFHKQFAADVPARKAALMAASQRPGAAAGLDEGAGEPAWRTIPSYHLIAKGDVTIPPAMQRFGAERANGVIKSVDASHAVFVSQPEMTAEFIERAARERA
ncbi:pimeloyl-ACP methyl ester carboxylesterase [Micromonospora sp. A200]|uniref:alpha/beta fold hydrolase n=1 Tax=Micromonospora sp. A200 TaxID=2940568 RepID=UPI002475C8AE|nr:alpha/beta hydrolase [Micromonospora sp. A200]MDH6464650.1 pimeloyl-ACP methyl ester carboxylesterase [Micromonospora sp. A200]